MDMFQKRILPTAIYLGLSSLAFLVYLFYERSLLGFPDGYLSDLDRAYYWLYLIFGIQHILHILIFVYFGFGYGTRKNWITFLLYYSGSIFLFFAIEWFLKFILDHGVGG
ncbi:hypothetical protein [Leptospira sarikeiensis]|uniref:Uncharacterized protein n=1 Tax=Leptospira sarikeiensis TaxID=2484943 RepID=A0A4R9K8Q3_9LEPT|nr:hypothetical protein [Leptospira sarikeiensis]TGL62984.1 hypothetical protein EHQ64_07375 [Leptospira sarikeiensis]